MTRRDNLRREGRQKEMKNGYISISVNPVTVVKVIIKLPTIIKHTFINIKNWFKND
jgi:hypothetical protein